MCMATEISKQSGESHVLDFTAHGYFQGNTVRLLADGVTTYHQLCHCIKSANHSIFIMTYILGTDETGRAIVKLLADRAKEGLKVLLLVDAFGSWLNCRKLLSELNQAGGKGVRFMPVLPLHTHSSANLRNHRKIAIFDYHTAIVGGQNLDKRFMAEVENTSMFCDFSVKIQGPAVSALTHVFIGDWAFATDTSPDNFRDAFAYKHETHGNSGIEVIASGPDISRDVLWERILLLIQECRRSVTIVTPYFIPDEVLMRSIIVKAHTGRKIRLILPETSNHPLVDMARNHYVRLLHSEGVEVLFYQPGIIHAKLIIVDHDLALLGSANIDLRSLFVNFEIGLLHTHIEDVRILDSWIDRILPDCLAFEDTRRAHFGHSRQLAEDFAHLLVPLL